MRSPPCVSPVASAVTISLPSMNCITAVIAAHISVTLKMWFSFLAFRRPRRRRAMVEQSSLPIVAVRPTGTCSTHRPWSSTRLVVQCTETPRAVHIGHDEGVQFSVEATCHDDFVRLTLQFARDSTMALNCSLPKLWRAVQ